VIQDPLSIISVEQKKKLSQLVQERAQARWKGEYDAADEIRDKIALITLPDEVSIIIQDFPRRQGGGSAWSLSRSSTITLQPGDTVLQLAHSALGMAVANSDRGIATNPHQVEQMRQQVKARLQESSFTQLQFELRGRKAADAAFWFALAGIQDSDVLDQLANLAAQELLRFGTRDSCRAKDIYQIMERFAAAGLRKHRNLQESAVRALKVKFDVNNEANEALLDFFSEHCLLMIWKVSTRQRKQRHFMTDASKHWINTMNGRPYSVLKSQSGTEVEIERSIDWKQVYSDPTRPLVVDIGCGMGVSLLGLAQQQDCLSSVSNKPWSECNFAGCDLSWLAVTYAQSLCQAWHLRDRLNFFHMSAECLLKGVQAYPGPVILCLIQFPTPYRLQRNVEATRANYRHFPSLYGNQQLPQTVKDGFMVTETLLQLTRDILDHNTGKMLVQSNCEDVAVWIFNSAKRCGFLPLDLTQSFHCQTNAITPLIPTKRTLDWVAMGGERATGVWWADVPILPERGRTETEVACILNRTPVHRCLLSSLKDSSTEDLE
jgi:SAM-dependent methyltransferase